MLAPGQEVEIREFSLVGGGFPHWSQSFEKSRWWARGDLNPHILSDTGT
jgi:hypothetical protein